MEEKVSLKDSFVGIGQKLGKAIMMPISILPVAGLFLGIAAALSSGAVIKAYSVLDNSFLQGLFKLMNAVGNGVFGALPLIFAVGIAAGLAKAEKGSAGLSAVVGYFVLLTGTGAFMSILGKEAPAGADIRLYGQAMQFGIKTLNMNVFGGVLAGIVTGVVHNKYYKTKLPDVLAFFGGARFVPIATAVIVGIVGLVIPLIWPFFNGIIIKIGELIGKAGVFGPLLFGAGEGVLRPFGLHHILVAMIRFTSAGGEAIINGEPVYGALNIFYKEFANGILDPNVTRFLSQGKMPSYMFGLPAVALAIYHTARPENRKKVKGLLASGIVACVIGGITEPLEFIFLFLSPVLYLFHCIMVGLGFMTMGILKVAIGNTDGNLIDFVVFGILQGFRTKWYLVIPVGIVWFAIYYFVFKYAILKYDLKTPGRELVTNDSDIKLGGYDAEKLLKALGGKENIVSLDNCITRLRLVVNDMSVVNEDEIKATGAIAVVKLDATNLQVIIGPQVHVVKNKLDKLMK